MKNKGFSLVELIVVIAIMAILVGVAVPVYTSYIGKANAAKDEQLLGEINSAFMVAAVDNNIDFSKLTSDNNKIIIDADGKVTFDLYDESTTDDVDLNADVAAILPGELTFKTIEEVWYNSSARAFVNDTPAAYKYGDETIYLSPSDIAALKNSTFMTADGLGINNLLDKVNYVAGFAAALDSSTYAKILGTPEYMKTFLSSMGVDVSTLTTNEALTTSFNEKFGALVAKKAETICEHNVDNSADCNECMSTASSQLLANAAVLHAANSTNQSKDDLMSALQSGDKTTDNLLTLMKEDEAKALSQASAAYGLYVSYAYSLPIGSNEREAAIAATSTPTNIVLNLGDAGFQEYLKTKQAMTDLEGYLGAMNMINDSTANNATAVENLLMNGFSNEELKTALGDATGDN